MINLGELEDEDSLVLPLSLSAPLSPPPPPIFCPALSLSLLAALFLIQICIEKVLSGCWNSQRPVYFKVEAGKLP